MAKKAEYTEESISQLKGADRVRKRPAVIFGSDGGATITADEVAAVAGTINYDIVCRLDCRVPRVFVSGGETIGTFSYIGNYFG